MRLKQCHSLSRSTNIECLLYGKNQSSGQGVAEKQDMQSVDGVSILVFADGGGGEWGQPGNNQRDKWTRKYRCLIIAMAHTLTHSLTHMSSTHKDGYSVIICELKCIH